MTHVPTHPNYACVIITKNNTFVTMPMHQKVHYGHNWKLWLLDDCSKNGCFVVFSQQNAVIEVLGVSTFIYIYVHLSEIVHHNELL